MSENDKAYIIKLEDNIEDILVKIGKSKGMVTIWTKGNEDKAEQFFLDSYLPPHKFILRCGREIWALYRDSIFDQQSVFAKILAENSCYFVSGTWQSMPEQESYLLTVQGDLYQAIRRSSFRLKSSARRSIRLKIEHNGETSTVNCLDVSLGGCAILINSFEKEKFVINQQFQNLILYFNNKPYPIPCATVARVEDRDDNKIFIGLRFEKISAGTEKNLFREINDEVRLDKILNHKKK